MATRMEVEYKKYRRIQWLVRTESILDIASNQLFEL
jgi:hypothetical protein